MSSFFLKVCEPCFNSFKHCDWIFWMPICVLQFVVQSPCAFHQGIFMAKHWMEFLETPSNGIFFMRLWTAGPGESLKSLNGGLFFYRENFQYIQNSNSKCHMPWSSYLVPGPFAKPSGSKDASNTASFWNWGGWRACWNTPLRCQRRC